MPQNVYFFFTQAIHFSGNLATVTVKKFSYHVSAFTRIFGIVQTTVF